MTKAGIILELPNGNFVFVKERAHASSNTPPHCNAAGGDCDPGETLEKTAIREAKEETSGFIELLISDLKKGMRTTVQGNSPIEMFCVRWSGNTNKLDAHMKKYPNGETIGAHEFTPNALSVALKQSGRKMATDVNGHTIQVATRALRALQQMNKI